MRVFFDTSSLFKKYIEENGSDQLEVILSETSEIIVAPTYLMEAISALTRRIKEKSISLNNCSWIKKEIKKDYHYYSVVLWTEEFSFQVISLIEKLSIRSLDAIQLASAVVSKADLFVTSDKQLYKLAKKALKKVTLL